MAQRKAKISKNLSTKKSQIHGAGSFQPFARRAPLMIQSERRACLSLESRGTLRGHLAGCERSHGRCSGGLGERPWYDHREDRAIMDGWPESA
jgi:hypothetical protein